MMNTISESACCESHRRYLPFAPFAMLGAVAVAVGFTSYLARPSGRAATPARRRQSLIAYLRDHLGGSDVAIGVVRRVAATHEGTPDGALCRWLANEFDDDRTIVRTLAAQLGASGRSIKRAGGYVSGALLSVTAGGAPGDLSLLRTFEALAVGIQGKRCLWRALQNLPTLPPAFSSATFVELEAKAVRQWEAVEDRRRALVAETFSTLAE